MAPSHFRMQNNEVLEKDPYVVSEQPPLNKLDSKLCLPMAKNSKNTKHTIHIE